MNLNQASISAWLANRQTRAWIHVSILLVLAGILLGSFSQWNLGGSPPQSPDGLNHYKAGQWVASISFYLAYLGILARVLLAGRNRKTSMTKTLLWIPSSIAAAILAAIVISLLLTLAKEIRDWAGSGTPQGSDLNSGLQGALSMLPGVALIMAVTPLFIPLDIILQIPKLMLTDMRTGIKSIDKYAQERKFHQQLSSNPCVLLVEDDVSCAAITMHFFRNLGWKCQHVSSIEAADKYLRSQLKYIRVIILDIFVGVGPSGDNTTGDQWLQKLHKDFPPDHRNFLVVVISGHTELLSNPDQMVDLILQKPWNPSQLLNFLKKKMAPSTLEKRST